MPAVIKKDLEAVIRATASETIALSALAAGSETVSKASINKIMWCGTWSVSRGGNKKYDLSGTGCWDLDSMGMANKEDADSNIVLTLTGVGSIVIKVKKENS